MRTLGSLLLILFLSGVAGTAAQFLRSDETRLPWWQDWSDHVEKGAALEGFPVVQTEAVAAALESGSYIHLFDARAQGEYDAGHLPTSMSLPVADFGTRFMDYMPAMVPEDRILVYCSGKECDESLALARALRDQGFTLVDIYVGGFSAWQEAGKGVE